MKNIFLTGEKQVGKSTLLMKLLKDINYSIGGYITNREVKDNIMTFRVQSLYDNIENYPIAKIDLLRRTREIYHDSFDLGLVSILEKSYRDKELIVLDELGFFESNSPLFISMVNKLLDSDKLVLGVLKDYDCDFLNNIKSRDDILIFNITKENRDHILDKIKVYLQ